MALKPHRQELPGTEPSYPVSGTGNLPSGTVGLPACDPPESSKTAPSGPERHPDVKSPAPRRSAAADIQALARIDRIALRPTARRGGQDGRVPVEKVHHGPHERQEGAFLMEPEWLKQAMAKGMIVEGAAINIDAILATPSKKVEGVEYTEAQFQRAVISLAQELGYKVAHFRRVRVQRANGDVYYETPVAADGKGWLDLFLVKPPLKFAIELKVGRNVPTQEQTEWATILNLCGIPARVFYPEMWDDLVKLLSGGS